MRKLAPIFLTGVFLSLHYAAILYVNSSYLAEFFDPGTVSTLFLLGALGNIALFFWATHLIRWFGPRMLFFLFLLILTVSTLFLGFGGYSSTIAISFVVYSSVLFMVYWCLDIFLEDASSDAKTGSIRGAYLTSLNTAVAFAPLLLAVFAEQGELQTLYLIASLLLIPPIFLSIFAFRLKEPPARGPVAKLPFKLWWERVNVRRATLARFLLELFYTFMIIYTPIYLHNFIGFDWAELGVMFTIMLLPFVIFEWPVGEMADRWYGEKEIMTLGFAIIVISLVLMPTLGATFALWTAVLFMSRVGASIAEVTIESYFFKHVGPEDAGFISIFRIARPVSIILGAALGVATLAFFSYDKLFWVLAVIMALGFTQSLALKDTK